MPKVKKVCNFKNKLDIVLLGFHLIEMAKLKTKVYTKRRPRGPVVVALTVPDPYTLVCIIHNGSFTTLYNNLEINHTLSYRLKMSLTEFRFDWVKGGELPSSFLCSFAEVTSIIVHENDENNVEITIEFGTIKTLKMKTGGVFVLPFTALDDDKLCFINFLRTLARYYRNVKYQFKPDTTHPDEKLAQFAMEMPLTDAEKAAGLKKKMIKF
jgi:hypothetical protein